MSSDRVTGQIQWWLRQAGSGEGLSSLQVRVLRRASSGRSGLDEEKLLSIAETVGDPDHPPGVSPNLEKSTFVEGDFVFVPSNDLGIGRFLGMHSTDDGQIAKIKYFDSPEEQHVREVSLQKIVGVHISGQTPCYVRGDDEWHEGRVRRHFPDEKKYRVNLEGGGDAKVHTHRIRVRWAQPTGDPTGVLAGKHHRSLYFRSKRLPYRKSILRQRTLARGYTGLLSSNVDLYPHQVEVVRRVLQDPIQRYLLADEVGLGKTIEAGAILRQYLLDTGAAAHAIAAVPASLKEQWEEELRTKFGVGRLSGQVEVMSLTELLKIAEDDHPDMLIIDEAHRVARWHGPAEEQEKYDHVKKLSHKAERLLLLSATPAHREDLTFLAMLHLVDPAMYPIDNVKGFEDRLEKREEVRQFLLDLTDQDDPFWLRESARDLKSVFPEDDRLSDLCDELLAVLDQDSVETGRPDTIVRLIRIHLRETYRLHHRMLRNRRHRVRENLDTRRSKKSEEGRALFEEYGLDDREEDLHDLLEDWRLDAVRASGALSSGTSETAISKELFDTGPVDETHRDEKEEVLDQYARLYELLVETAGSNLEALRSLVLRRLDASNRADFPDPTFGADLTTDEATALSAPRFDGEETLLSDIVRVTSRDLAPESMRRRELLASLLEYHLEGEEKAVVFTGRSETADALFDFLSRRASDVEAVAGHLTSMGSATCNDELHRFQNEPQCSVLVADRSGEEGRNLQEASLLVHYDLPWDPNRIEQRTGRVDRIGRHGRPLQTHVFLGPEVERELPTVHEAWHRILRDGFEVYESSIASLQFLVDRLMPDIRRYLFKRGTENLEALIETIRERVKAEIQHIRDQDVLDAIEAHKEESEAFYEDLSALDDYEESRNLQERIEGWVACALNFHRSSKPYPKGVLKYEPDYHGDTQIPRDQILNRFAPSLQVPSSYHRSVASRLKEIDLLRLGHPFFSEMDKYMEWDDRGRTYALWRHMPSWPREAPPEWAGFRLDFVVEADPDPLRRAISDGASLDYSALLRRADGYFPPRVGTVFIDPKGNPPPDVLQRVLSKEPEKKENGGRDVNLKERESVLHHFISEMQWESRCRLARSEGETMLRSSEDFQRRATLGVDAARRDMRERLERIRAREKTSSHASRASGYSEMISVERQVGEALVESIDTPSVRLESIGFMVASGKSLEQFIDTSMADNE